MREKTDSITHLVKIVAEEVTLGYFNKFHEKLDILEEDIDVLKAFNCKKVVHKIDMAEAEQRVLAQLIGNIESSVKKAGNYWTKEEDFLLVQEIRTAIAQIAQNHQRSKRSY